jgi:hypothetical protein
LLLHEQQDYVKEGVYYFGKLPNGEPNFASGPQLLLSGLGTVDMTSDPATGILYLVDLAHGRSVRLYNAAKASKPVGEPEVTSVSSVM